MNTMNQRLQFYRTVVDRCISNKDASILIVAGGAADKEVFSSLGCTNVTISNIDSRYSGNEFSPFQWSFQDAEHLTYDDGTFEYVVIHAALHHCPSPHRALLEMFRVARTAIIAFEARDSVLMRLFEYLKFSQTYEHAAVADNNCQFGGVNNTEIPNFVYRWTEREVRKTISAYLPIAEPRISFHYGHDAPRAGELMKSNKLRLMVIMTMIPLYKLFVLLFPKQQNLFAFAVQKPTVTTPLHPWLKRIDTTIVFNKDWARSKYQV